MDAIVEKLKKEDLLVFDDGRYIMWAPGVEIPLTGKFFTVSFLCKIERKVIFLENFKL